MVRLIALLVLFSAFANDRPAEAAPDGATRFARCAACHLPTGAGVPGVFPPFRDQISAFARAKAGREYLVAVVTHGLVGAISVHGKTFSGFMPAQPLSDAEVATTLNYVVNTIADTKPAATLFTGVEVASIRQRRQSTTAQDSRSLRPDNLVGPGQ